MKTVLVTGGAGFVGTRLAIGLRERGLAERVIAFDNLRRRGSEINLERLRAAGVSFVHGDVRMPDDLAEVGPVDAIIECSAEPSVLAGYTSAPAYVTQTNVVGTINVLEHARYHAAALVYLSSSRVYPIAALQGLPLRETETRYELADTQELPGVGPAGIREDFPLEGARSLYGTTKLCGELLAQEYAAMYGLPVVINRCGLLTGPGQMGKADQGVIALWAARHVYGGSLKYIGYGGTGKQVRDFLHIDDLLDLVEIQLRQLPQHAGATYNVGGGRPFSVSLRELTALCQEQSGNTIDIAPDPEWRAPDVPIYLSDTARVCAASGWRPRRGAAETVGEIVAWLRDNESTLRPILS